MKRVLSIIATIAGALYLAAGAGLLTFQSEIKAAMGYGADYGVEIMNVYPVQNILELVLIGVPCVALGILSMSESIDDKRGVNLLLVMYGSAVLVLRGSLINIGSVINTTIVSRSMGTAGLVNMNLVSSSFGWIQFLSSLPLVLLLLRGALNLGEINVDCSK